MNFLRNVAVDVEPTTTPSIEEEVAKWHPHHSYLDHEKGVTVVRSYPRYESVEAEELTNVRHLQDIGQGLREEGGREMKRPFFAENVEVLNPSYTKEIDEGLHNYGQDIDANTWKVEEAFRSNLSPVPKPTANHTPRWNHTDHRLRRTDEFSETSETIHKRLGRAILSIDSDDGYMCGGGNNTAPEDAENIMIVEEISDDSNFDKLTGSRCVSPKKSIEDKKFILAEGMARSGNLVLSNSSVDNLGREAMQYQYIPLPTNDGACIVNSVQEKRHPQLGEAIANDSDNEDTSIENTLMPGRNEEKSITSCEHKNTFFVCDDPDCSFLPDEDFVNEDWDD